MSKLLFEAASADGNSAVYQVPQGGKGPNTYTIHTWGTFGGGVVKLQASYDGTTYIDITSASWSAAAIANIDIKTRYIRANLASSTGASVYLWIGN